MRKSEMQKWSSCPQWCLLPLDAVREKPILLHKEGSHESVWLGPSIFAFCAKCQTVSRRCTSLLFCSLHCLTLASSESSLWALYSLHNWRQWHYQRFISPWAGSSSFPVWLCCGDGFIKVGLKKAAQLLRDTDLLRDHTMYHYNVGDVCFSLNDSQWKRHLITLGTPHWL